MVEQRSELKSDLIDLDLLPWNWEIHLPSSFFHARDMGMLQMQKVCSFGGRFHTLALGQLPDYPRKRMMYLYYTR